MLILYLICMEIDTTTAYKKPFPIATIKLDSPELFPAFSAVIILINIRMVISKYSERHPRRVLKKTLGVQKRSLLRYVVVMNWRDSSGVLSYTVADSNI